MPVTMGCLEASAETRNRARTQRYGPHSREISHEKLEVPYVTFLRGWLLRF